MVRKQPFDIIDGSHQKAVNMAWTWIKKLEKGETVALKIVKGWLQSDQYISIIFTGELIPDGAMTIPPLVNHPRPSTSNMMRKAEKEKCEKFFE